MRHGDYLLVPKKKKRRCPSVAPRLHFLNLRRVRCALEAAHVGNHWVRIIGSGAAVTWEKGAR